MPLGKSLHLGFFVAIIAFALVGTSRAAVAATTYYIDCATGSDSNAGTSTAAPWRRQPYMSGFTGSYAHAAGDRFIFKGGVTCPNSFFPLVPRAGGAPGAPDYYGASRDWFAGATWQRPVFDSEGKNVGRDPKAANYDDEIDFDTYGASWVTIDNIEFTGHYWSGPYPYSQNVTIKAMNEEDGIVIENCYFHGWSHAPYKSEPATEDSYRIVNGSTSAVPGNRHGYIDHSVFSGADGDGASGDAVYYWPRVSNSNFAALSNAINGAFLIVNNNIIHDIRNSFDPTQHMNAIEVWTSPAIPSNYVYDNIVYDTENGVLPIDVGSWANPGSMRGYVFNNVVWHAAWMMPMSLDHSCSPSVPCDLTRLSFHVWNNTLVNSNADGDACVRVAGAGTVGALDARNNLCISDAHQGSILTTDPRTHIMRRNEENDLMLSPTDAAAEGLTVGDAYAALAPDASTVGAGANLSAECDNPPLAALCADLKMSARPAQGAWDIGAYQHR